VRREGRISAGGVEIDAAYRTKYRRYAASIVDSVLTPEARAATIQLVPRPTGRETG
jgi:hypothetical protein